VDRKKYPPFSVLVHTEADFHRIVPFSVRELQCESRSWPKSLGPGSYGASGGLPISISFIQLAWDRSPRRRYARQWLWPDAKNGCIEAAVKARLDAPVIATELRGRRVEQTRKRLRQKSASKNQIRNIRTRSTRGSRNGNCVFLHLAYERQHSCRLPSSLSLLQPGSTRIRVGCCCY